MDIKNIIKKENGWFGLGILQCNYFNSLKQRAIV